ncbi:MAG TPA: DUF192 domain-containing protein [Blastocatellia bacterium]|nr:DUF192 domain-containing protein [Blastocatellia bacterium]
MNRTMRTKAKSFKFYHHSTGECVAERVMLANTALKRLRGLIGKSGLESGEALWLRPSSGVHTFGMRFAIDVIFLDRELRIVKLIENMRPFRLAMPHLKAVSVLEMKAHSIARIGLRVGDQLKLVRSDGIDNPA